MTLCLVDGARMCKASSREHKVHQDYQGPLIAPPMALHTRFYCTTPMPVFGPKNARFCFSSRESQKPVPEAEAFTAQRCSPSRPRLTPRRMLRLPEGP